MFYLQAKNDPNRHALLPDNYPTQVSTKNLGELWIEISSEDLSILQASFDLTDYINSTVSIPVEVTNQQLRQALILKSFNDNNQSLHPDSILIFLKTLPEPTRSIALNFWEYSNAMQRSNAVLNQLSPMLGLTSADVDGLFIHAGSLV